MSKALKTGDSRIFAETYLTKAVPPTATHPGHPVGSPVRLIANLMLGSRKVSFTYPRLSRTIFEQAKHEIDSAEKFKVRAIKSISTKGHIKPHTEGMFDNEEALFMCLQCAFQGILGLCSALEAVVSEEFSRDPQDLTIDGKLLTPDAVLKSNGPGIITKITKILPAKTDKSNPAADGTIDFSMLNDLVNLRHSIQHWQTIKKQWIELDKSNPIYQILNYNLDKYVSLTDSIISHFVEPNIPYKVN